MIKINLALRKQAVALDMGKKKGAGGGLNVSNFKFDPEILKEPQLRKLVLVLVVAVMGTYLLNGYEDDQSKQQDLLLAQATAEGTKLQAQLSKTASYEGMKKQLDADEELIKTKLSTIQKLIADRQVPPKLLLSLSSGIPKEVWLSELALTTKDIHMKGFSLGFDAITEFMKSLGDNELLSDLKLNNSQKSTDAALGLLDEESFELEAKRKQVE
jgi:Tfp pilus assembly protein PilN